MARRQSQCLRNLDDSLKLWNFITLKSAGLVVMFFGLCHLAEMVSEQVFWRGGFAAVFGVWSMAAEFALTGACACALSWVERHDDEHLVPSTIAYFVERPWRSLYSGVALDEPRPHAWEDIFHV